MHNGKLTAKLLILDLDDTLFNTKSIDKAVFASLFDDFHRSALLDYSEDIIPQITDALWQYPFDQVASKYNFSEQLKGEFISALNHMEFKLEIEPFQDIEFLARMPQEKILVTTGFEHLQMAKINALGIESLFSEFHIDDIMDSERKYKSGIFKEIISTRHLNAGEVVVIGDNPDSELKAGKALGTITVQMSRFGQAKSSFSDYLICGFDELKALIN